MLTELRVRLYLLLFLGDEEKDLLVLLSFLEAQPCLSVSSGGTSLVCFSLWPAMIFCFPLSKPSTPFFPLLLGKPGVCTVTSYLV